MDINFPPFPIFEHIPGFPGYAVTNNGTVWTCKVCGNGFGKTKEWTQIKPFVDESNRPFVVLFKDKKQFRKGIHKLVKLTFHGQPKEGQIIRHYDGNPMNNHINNLIYGNYKENEEDKERHGRRVRGDKHPIAKLTVEDVKQIKTLLVRPIKRGTIAKLAKQFNIDGAVISRIRDNKVWSWVTI